MNRRRALFLSFAAALMLPMSSCTLSEQGGWVGTAGIEGYTPDYYEGNAIYFDNDEPYYFVGDEARYVPRDRPEYVRFREHHQRFGPAYRRWYNNHPPRRALRGRPGERRDERHEQWQERRHNGERY